MVKLRVNGQDRAFDGDPSMPLLWYLRDEPSLTGTKFGCGMALCGACTVHVDGQATRVLHHRARRYRRRSVIDHRGARPRRQPSGAKGLAHGQRAAMRLLPSRADHAGGGIADDQRRPVGGRNPERHDRQYLPLRLLPAHHRRRTACGDGSLTHLDRIRSRRHSRMSAAAVSARALVASGGLVIAAVFLPARAAPPMQRARPSCRMARCPTRMSLSRSTPAGIVTIIAHRAEMGPGSRTSLPMAVADEIDADWARVRVQQAPGDETKYGNQDTDGSRSLRHFIQPMRQCGAAMRHMLEMAAAAHWGVDVSEVQAQNHEVVHSPSGRKLGYGELAAAASALPTPPTAGQAQGRGRVSLYRQGPRPDLRPFRHYHRPRRLRHRRQVAGDEVRGRRPPAGAGRQAAPPTTPPRR